MNSGCTARRAASASLPRIPQAGNLQHGEWLAIPLEHEATLRRQKRFEVRARTAKLRHAANVEDIACDSIRQHRNLLVTGPTGIGKSWIAGFGLD